MIGILSINLLRASDYERYKVSPIYDMYNMFIDRTDYFQI